MQRVVNGAVQSTVLDLAVNSASERGLLGIALHPVSARGLSLLDREHDGRRHDVLTRRRSWATASIASSGTARRLTLHQNIIKLRAIQQDAGQPERGNHDGGMIKFGPDGSCTSSSATSAGAARCRTCADGPFGPGHARRSVRRPASPTTRT